MVGIKKNKAEQKAEAKFKSWEKRSIKALDAYVSARAKRDKYEKQYDEAKNAKTRAKALKLKNDWAKTTSSKEKAYKSAKRKASDAKKSLNKLVKKRQGKNKDLIADQLNAHDSGFKNEGHAAIYETQADSADVIFISPSDQESEDNSVNVTSWPVDEGEPRSDYARMASKTITVSGIITGDTRQETDQKFEVLKHWNSQHLELTYSGSFTYNHLIMTSLGKTENEFATNIKVSITFTYVYAAEITKEAGAKTNKKTSKSSKTVAGNRKSKYTKITIKPGDTLYGLSKKYGKSVAWLQKVNGIKGTTIYAGKPLRVK